jgi:hypothetical protein
MLGITLPGRAHDATFYLGKAPPAPCAYDENRNCPHATPQWVINEPNFYHLFILL